MLTILFVATTASSRLAVEIQLWLIWVRVATAIPLFTVDIVHADAFGLGWLRVALVVLRYTAVVDVQIAGGIQLLLARRYQMLLL